MTKSILQNQSIHSPLMSASQLRPQKVGRKKSIAMTLVLTSLVDAFCMLVIYLMFNISPGGQTPTLKSMNIPTVSHSDIFSGGIVIRFESGRYYLNDEEVAKEQLAVRLSAFKRDPSAPMTEGPQIVIQADRESAFSSFNPIILAGAQNGFTTFKFAVINKGG